MLRTSFSTKRAIPLALALVFVSAEAGAQSWTFRDINPDNSSLAATNRNRASGGRVNGLASVSGSSKVFYAATEWGGIYQTLHGGWEWTHLDGHLPTATWDVEVDPSEAGRILATSFYDGRVNSIAGINVSTDAGVTWAHPATASPPAGFCQSAAREESPSAFGIAFDPETPANVYVGTNCGLATSTDSGGTWSYVNPITKTEDPAPPDDIFDVIVHNGGTIDVCGDTRGHYRSTDGGANWVTATGTLLPGGRCSLAVSPDESYVLFAAVSDEIFESDDGGDNWNTRFVNPSPQGRIPFVATNQRTGNAFDLWFGDVLLWRAACTTPSPEASGGIARCPASDTWANSTTGGHVDCGDVAFDPTPASNACPALFSSDGGIYRNTKTTSPGCHTPVWEQPNLTPHATWLWDMSGANQAGTDDEDLYFGLQDNGVFASTDASTSSASGPSWTNMKCCDGFDVESTSSAVLFTQCCYGSPGPETLLIRANPGMTSRTDITDTITGTLHAYFPQDSIAQFGPDDFVIVTSTGVYVTQNINATQVSWTQLGSSTSPAGACGVRVGMNGTTPTFVAKAGECRARVSGTLWSYSGTAASGTWTQINAPDPAGGFGAYAVDPNDPERLFVSHLVPGNDPQMLLSDDGGANWAAMPNLDNLMTAGGTFRYQTQRGPTDFTGFNGYPQPSLVAFDPFDDNVLVAGGADTGVFLSTNKGKDWTLLSGSLTSPQTARPNIPRPRFAYFDHLSPPINGFNLFVGTQGRGVWRIDYRYTGVPSTANVWMKDLLEDTGGEPDPATAGEPMWKSPYIWVRRAEDTDLEHEHDHQDPQQGQTNYVYVKLHNTGGTSESSKLELYYAKASTNLNDPASWTRIGAEARTIAPGVDVAKFDWSGIPGSGHYCLLARWNIDGTPLAFTSLEDAVRADNDLIWRNVNVIELGGPPETSAVFAMTGDAESTETYLLITTKPMGRRQVDWAQLVGASIQIDPARLDRRRPRLAGVRRIGRGEFEFTLGRDVKLIGPFVLRRGEKTQVRLTTIADPATVKRVGAQLANPAHYDITVMQIRPDGVRLAENPSTLFQRKGLVIGGVSYTLRVPARK